MFNLKKVSVMVASALYLGVGASAAALDNDRVWSEKPAGYAPKPLPVKQQVWDGNINKTLKKQHQVFTPEEGIAGVHTYIVQLSDEPIANYDGSLSQFAGTKQLIAKQKAQKHSPLDLQQPELASYANHLASKRQAVLHTAMIQQGLNINVEREFSVTLNGFTSQMTQQEAALLAKVAGVKKITRSKLLQLSTFNSIEQTGAKALWQASSTNPSSNKGEGTIIGVIDTGINSDHPAFAAVGDDGYTHTNPLGDTYLGDCAKAEFANHCNDKLIGIYSYPEITAAFSDPVFSEARPAYGEDYNSHGSHVAGTAAGNILKNINYKLPQPETQSTGLETNVVFEEVSGMAPHANIVSYQVCYPGNQGDPFSGCPTSAIVAAIEQATIDNVDVLNASLGAAEEDPWSDPVEQAFMNAAQSGVFVAVAAGNNGPNFSSADHSSPWVTTVAAHSPASQVTLKDKELINLSGGDTTVPEPMTGAGINFNEISGLIVSAADFSNPNESSPYAIANCDKPFPAGTFDLTDDPDTAIDESTQDVIVVCKRSAYPLYTKSLNVEEGGAEGLIIYNHVPYLDNYSSPIVTYPIPAMLIKNTDGVKLTDWLSSGNSHLGTIAATEGAVEDVDQERVAYFSGRGPSFFGIDTLLVDVAAPGVDIYAPAADDQPFTNAPRSSDWQTLSGTSMASPHVAGAAALLKQSHPDWTPMQIQSALMLTASDQLKNGRFLDNYADDGFDAALQDMGSGRINVELADKAGLLVDESIDAMAAANPNLGGKEKRLNTAYLVDSNCGFECTFIRTFTATEDATWTIDTENWIGNATISVQPSTFNIKKGESQSVVVTVKAQQEATPQDMIDYTGNQGKLILTSSNPESPVLELPVWTYVGESGLPEYIKVNAHRRSSTMTVGPFNTTEISQFTSRSYGLTKAAQTTVHLFNDTTPADPFDLVEVDGKQINNNHIEWTSVPADSKMFSASVMNDANKVLVFMGHDSNEDGIATFEEVLCMSTSYTISNFCTIVDPLEGQYFTAYMSLQDLDYGEVDQGIDVTFATAVVTEDNGSLTVTGPSSVSGYDDYELSLAYNLPEMEVGDIYFGGFDLGSNAEDAGNLGFVPVIINQIDKDVSFTANKQQTFAGDIVDFEISVIANNEDDARDFALATEFPDSIQIIQDSIIASAATPAVPELAENKLSLAGTQKTTKDVERSYIFSSNADDAMCSLAAADSPYPDYLDLVSLGWRTLEGVQGQYYHEFEYSFKELMATDQEVSFPFFNKYHFNSIKLNPAGVLSFGENGRMSPFHLEFPETYGQPTPPPYIIAPFWVGDNTIPERVDAPYNPDLNAGITPTYTVERDWLVLEWDNIERSQTTGQSIDVEMFMRMGIDYEPGGYELLFAYDNVTLVDDQGSIGVKAFNDRKLIDGDMPVDINIGSGFGFNNMDELIHDGLVVCLDYIGPEISKFNVKFQAYVSEQAANQNHELKLINGLTGADDETISLNLAVNGNINLAQLADMQVEENQSISFDVIYADENKVSNQITVLGENFSYEVSDHSSGGTVTLTPADHFYGDIDVTVKVADNVNPNDAAMSSFTLSVISDGIELGCTDSDATNYDANANQDDGSCSYPETVTPDPEVEVEKKSSSGSFGWLLLVISPLLALRRKSLVNKG